MKPTNETKETKETQPVPPASGSDGSGYSLELTIVRDGARADGKAANEAEVKLTLGNFLESDRPVTFKVVKGSAVFSNGLQQIDGPKTSIKGRSSVTFTDTTAERGVMVAWMSEPPKTRSNETPYTFVAVPGDAYGFSLDRLVNHAQADGSARNAANVAVYRNGGPAPDKTRVTFQLPAGSAHFVTDDANVVASGTLPDGGTWITVDAAFIPEGGATIAGAQFTDANVGGETVTVSARLTDHAQVPAQQQDYTFSPRSAYVVTITQSPSYLGQYDSGEVTGTVVDRETGEGISALCGIGYTGPAGGASTVEAVDGVFSFGIGSLAVIGRSARFAYVSVSYGGAGDRARVLIYPT